MFCLKCGKEVKDGHSFCEKCLEGMKEYPVKPGTPIQLPNRKLQAAARRNPSRRRMQPKDKELITKLYRRNQLLVLLLLLTVLLLSFVTITYFKKVLSEPVKQPGQNWVVAETTAETAGTSE